jgi:hypothetical protein
MTLSLELWLPPLVGGLALLLMAAVWRLLARERGQRRARALLALALVDPDPLARLAAVQVAVQRGIAPVAGELLRATRTERDETVLDGITEAVARHQWEPTLEPELLELRLWAQRRLMEVRHDERERRRLAAAADGDGAASALLLPTANGAGHEPVAPPWPSRPPDRVNGWLPGSVSGWLPGDRASRPRARGRR